MLSLHDFSGHFETKGRYTLRPGVRFGYSKLALTGPALLMVILVT